MITSEDNNKVINQTKHMQQSISQTELELIKAENKVINLMPEYNGIMALIDFEALQTIISYLDVTTFARIKEEHIHNVNSLKVSGTDEDIKNFITLLEKEAKFHRTVNLIKTVNISETTENL